jgi:hypothetical protein
MANSIPSSAWARSALAHDPLAKARAPQFTAPVLAREDLLEVSAALVPAQQDAASDVTARELEVALDHALQGANIVGCLDGEQVVRNITAAKWVKWGPGSQPETAGRHDWQRTFGQLAELGKQNSNTTFCANFIPARLDDRR